MLQGTGDAAAESRTGGPQRQRQAAAAPCAALHLRSRSVLVAPRSGAHAGEVCARASISARRPASASRRSGCDARAPTLRESMPPTPASADLENSAGRPHAGQQARRMRRGGSSRRRRRTPQQQHQRGSSPQQTCSYTTQALQPAHTLSLLAMQGAADAASRALVRRRGSIEMEERPYARPHARHHSATTGDARPARGDWALREAGAECGPAGESWRARPSSCTAAVCPAMHSTQPRHLARKRQAGVSPVCGCETWTVLVPDSRCVTGCFLRCGAGAARMPNARRGAAAAPAMRLLSRSRGELPRHARALLCYLCPPVPLPSAAVRCRCRAATPILAGLA